MSFQRVCSTSALAEEEACRAKLAASDGSEVCVAVARDCDGDWHAVGDLCTHGNVSLSEGDVEDYAIECWGHSARFDLRTGQPTLPATAPVAVYPIEIDGEDVLVDVDHPHS
ncbi:MAG: non-heme iron oxygenase ferredoxin subunit [Actinomycetaceae bacterium]|nr:non-heme iron oxygenase ferredoxin subunit [Actinomycetaceae bacterium]MDU0969610.1 non-heme iron oxygenase ferredoxin subunit [Actinomycetaceae bacterium]